MVRQEIDKRPKAAGKKIKKVKKPKQMELFPDVAELGNYRYSCFITSLTLPAKAVYDLYRGRADSENTDNVVTLTTTVGFEDGTQTRALTEAGVKTFATDDQIAVIYT